MLKHSDELNKYVSVAQLDRASGYGPEGREFESCHSHPKADFFGSLLLFCIYLKYFRETENVYACFSVTNAIFSNAKNSDYAAFADN